MPGEMNRILVTLFVLVSLAGCGGGSAVSSTSAKLHVTVWSQGESGGSVTYTLACPRGTGTLPAARSACSKLRRIGVRAFAPVPANTACTAIYGGPQLARVTGSVLRMRLEAGFNRSNGCEIARWDRLAFLFPPGS
jgi:hypothetical protein